MKTTNERISTMIELENLVEEWFSYVEDFGNETAYTDALIEAIKRKVKEL